MYIKGGSNIRYVIIILILIFIAYVERELLIRVPKKTKNKQDTANSEIQRLANDSKVSPKTIQERSGHHSSQFSLDIYTHKIEDIEVGIIGVKIKDK